MVKQVVITIEEGSFESGFPVSLEFWENDRVIARNRKCHPLPRNPDFPRIYDEWRSIYTRLGLGERVIEINEGQVTNVASLEECENATRNLESNERNWLGAAAFGDIRGRIVGKFQNLTPSESVRVIIDTSNPYLHRLSWDYWDLFEKPYLPQAEFTLLSQHNPPITTWQKPIRILAIFGSDRGGLQLEQDRKLIENLERDGAKITSIPARGDSLTYQELYKTIRRGNWDTIFYAGHSSDRTVNVNPTLNVPIDALRGAFRKAAPTVKLAIFNSCDGLDIGEYLADFDIPNMIVMREPVPDLVARSFLQFFLKEFTQGQPLHAAVREARECLEELEFSNSDGVYHPRASKLPVLIQNPTAPELYWPEPEAEPLAQPEAEPPPQPEAELLRQLRRRRRRIMQIIVLFSCMLIGLMVFLVIGKTINPKPPSTPEPTITLEPSKDNIGKKDNISEGEEILVKLSQQTYKKNGVEKFKNKSYLVAAQDFQKSWNDERRDPETLIYLNNAILEATGVGYDTIAVAVPVLARNADIAQEMLRGVAQAQTEVNLSLSEELSNFTLPGKGFLTPKRLNGKGLKVIIANDANNKEQAKKVANTIAKRSEILGVVGHWTSETTTATVDIYNQHELVMVSPGASTSILTEKPRKFFFRTNITNRRQSEKMVDVLMDKFNQNRVAVFYNPDSEYSGDYKKRFEEEFVKKGGKQKNIIDDPDISHINQLDFNAENAIKRLSNYGELVIALIPDGQVTDALGNALEIIKENRGQNLMVGNWSVYSPKTLNIAQLQLVEKLIVIVPWHSLSNPDSYFSQTTKKLWEGSVSGRTALSYDAAQVLIKGIEENGEKHRREIKKTLADKNFRVEGVTGEITFEEGKGDRKIQPLELVKIVSCPTVQDKERVIFIPEKYSKSEDAGLDCGNYN
ncbi:ABC transporter substrate-binding protein [Okeania sp. SIO2B3]|uniref:ABC transporter substrate-binding protein n=1 Tax=Okeania sp. SIO2B3 TaxID=2607784 RepID=UPI0013C21C3B|nr:ABC transporter substrate-binding protein [Okeania sp. SIO2B3]NET44730.1 ABC transporter substrate-binding protein [Okeania sp. SIO2B3]